jgi:translation initiation factor IF-2
MSDVTVRQLAEVVGIPLDRLLTQLCDAGLAVNSADDMLSDAEKLKLLSYLRQSHGKEQAAGAEPKKVTLQRRTVSELKQGKVTGKNVKTVSVEVRKKRTYVKRSELPETDERRLEAEKARQVLDIEDSQRFQREAVLQKQKEDEEDRLRKAAQQQPPLSAGTAIAPPSSEENPPTVVAPRQTPEPIESVKHKPVEVKSTEDKITELKAKEDKSLEFKLTEDKSAEPKPVPVADVTPQKTTTITKPVSGKSTPKPATGFKPSGPSRPGGGPSRPMSSPAVLAATKGMDEAKRGK